MREFASVALVDPRGWVLMQERDEHAPVDPDRWCFPGGGVEPGESPEEAAYRELAEETGVRLDDGLELHLRWTMPSTLDGVPVTGHLYAAGTALTDDDIVCGEGRQMVFVAPDVARGLDLATYCVPVLPEFLDSDLYHRLRSVPR